MTETLPGLSRKRRMYLFIAFLCVFAISIPALIFYSSGYRLEQNGGTARSDATLDVVSTGGMYIVADKESTSLYIDDEPVRETRTFRGAMYISGVMEGKHRVQVRKDASHTWVKNLDVYPYLVSEAFAINLPLNPEMVHVGATSSDYKHVSVLFASSSATTSVLGASGTATTSNIGVRATDRLRSMYSAIQEASSFNEKNATITQDVLKESGGVRLYREGTEVFARYVGGLTRMPYYYCARQGGGQSTAVLLGDATPSKSVEIAGASNVSTSSRTSAGARTCLPVIKIDTQGHLVRRADFYPDSTDFVVLERDDGVYVTEIDDRGGWQNTQPILKGQNLSFAIYNNSIYVFDGKNIYRMILETD